MYVFFSIVVSIFFTFVFGMLGYLLKIKEEKSLNFFIEIARGIMMGIICFELIPNAIECSNTYITTMGILTGIIIVVFVENIIEKANRKESINRIGIKAIIISMAITLHNIPEGMAIGSGFIISEKTGITMLIAMIIHDIPESIVAGTLFKIGNKTPIIALYNLLIIGIATSIGILVGNISGIISNEIISFNIGVAGGAMLYIVASEMVTNDKIFQTTYMLGIIAGLILSS